MNHVPCKVCERVTYSNGRSAACMQCLFRRNADMYYPQPGVLKIPGVPKSIPKHYDPYTPEKGF